MVDANCQSIWDDCLRFVSSRIKPQSYTTWFSQTGGLNIEGNNFNISVPNKFVSEWLDEHYSNLITEALQIVTGKDYDIVFNVNSNNSQPDEKTFRIENKPVNEASEAAQRAYIKTSSLNLRYSFDNFVVGESNQFAQAAAMAVAEAPGKTKYNPLYIYGGVGLGKTHLVQAVGNFVQEVYPNMKTLYISSEKFTSDFISSISSKSTNEFVNFYRNVDLLLLDDIQFFAGKESTQVQFFHTFNVLYQTGKQIILTSDRAPKDIGGLEERLLSRFHWGLVTDIQPPDLETRIAIIKNKSAADNMDIPDNVVVYIAEHITNNIRELEGSLIRLLAYASLTKKPITIEVASKILRDTIPEASKQLTIDTIIRKVAKSFKIPEAAIVSKKKTQDLVNARSAAMYLSRKLTNASLKQIGSEFSGRDHSTVIHAVNQVSDRIKTDQEYKSQIDDIINSLYT